MYQTLFSEQWMFDRCIEMDFLSQFMLLLIPVIGFVLFFRFRFQKTKKVISSLIFGLLPLTGLFLVLITVVSYVGWFVVGCSWGWFWKPVNKAHEFHWLIKEYKSHYQSYPTSERELMNISPSLYAEIKKYSQTIYSYNKDDNSFIWVVRPSYYYLVVFDSKVGYSFYNTNLMSKIMNPEFDIYPLSYPRLK